jgi:Ca2+-binding RTX toxin-like protein
MTTPLSRRTQVLIDQLEARQLLAASVVGTQLRVAGTTKADAITITYNGSARTFAVVLNGASSSFPLGKIRSISVTADAGNDVVTLPSNLPSTVKTTATDLGPGSDRFTGSNRNDTASGRAGNDTLTGNSGDDNLYGDAGNDSLVGGAGNKDRIYPGLGNDTSSGGSGNYDTLTYQDRSDGVTARIDGGVSGAPGETDTALPDFENVVGGDGNDLVIGNAGVNVVGGARGNDTLDGGLGADMIFGDDGNDTVTYASRSTPIFAALDATANDGAANEKDYIITCENLIGGSGNDTLVGDNGVNKLFGNAGNDSLIGLDGKDSLQGGDGNDTMDGGKLADVVDGGAGTDTSKADSADRVTTVETIK